MNKTALITGANKGILIHGQSPLSRKKESQPKILSGCDSLLFTFKPTIRPYNIYVITNQVYEPSDS